MLDKLEGVFTGTGPSLASFLSDQTTAVARLHALHRLGPEEVKGAAVYEMTFNIEH